MQLVKNARVRAESTIFAASTCIVMSRLIISSLLITGLTIQIASHTEIFNALCDDNIISKNKNV
tara:strand:+ start:286 stop:477 length:192 start_codon:yes stop_codon:yes gene_type:complete